MSFVTALRHARKILSQEKRVSIRALERELGLEGSALDDLVAELVDVSRVAVRDGSTLTWTARESNGSTDAGERRQLSVLFCDMVGSTALAERLDAEDWSDLLREYQGAVRQVVEQFGGYVAQYLGDGILAYFGYPTAYEDDAERAIRAGITSEPRRRSWQPFRCGWTRGRSS